MNFMLQVNFEIHRCLYFNKLGIHFTQVIDLHNVSYLTDKCSYFPGYEKVIEERLLQSKFFSIK